MLKKDNQREFRKSESGSGSEKLHNRLPGFRYIFYRWIQRLDNFYDRSKASQNLSEFKGIQCHSKVFDGSQGNSTEFE